MFGSHLEHKNHPMDSATKNFVGELSTAVINLMVANGLDPKLCKFVGNNDVIAYRHPSILVLALSCDTRLYAPTYAEYDVPKEDLSEAQLKEHSSVSKPTLHQFNNDQLQTLSDGHGLVDPVGLVIPLNYLSLSGEEKDEAIASAANVLLEPAKQDIDRYARIVRVNPIFQGRDFLLDPDLVFVLMDFGDEYTRIYNTLIKPTVEDEGFRCVRSDDIFRDTAVIEDIWENINKAALIVAEISNNNANVMYELGICHTVGKNVMMLTQNRSEIPFNFRHLRYYPYENNIPGSEELKRNISSFLQNIRARQQAAT